MNPVWLKLTLVDDELSSPLLILLSDITSFEGTQSLGNLYTIITTRFNKQYYIKESVDSIQGLLGTNNQTVWYQQ